jgi:hypothetical protein
LRVASHLPAEKTIPLYEDVVLPAFSELGNKEEEKENENEEGEKKKGTDGNLCYALLSCLYKWNHAEEVCILYIYIYLFIIIIFRFVWFFGFFVFLYIFLFLFIYLFIYLFICLFK